MFNIMLFEPISKFVFNLVCCLHPQSHNFSKIDAKPTLFEVGCVSAFPTNGPEPNQLTLLLVAWEAETEAVGTGSGLLFGLLAPVPAPVSLHVCQSHARPSKIGLLGAGGGGSVVVRLAFGVTTT